MTMIHTVSIVHIIMTTIRGGTLVAGAVICLPGRLLVMVTITVTEHTGPVAHNQEDTRTVRFT